MLQRVFSSGSIDFDLKKEVTSGLTVALALVPEAVAFAFVAGVDPLVGLYAAFMVGLVTSIFGGRPGMISGATGALAVVMVSLVKEGNAMGAPDDSMGLYYLFATVILMGCIQIAAGVFRLGKFVRLIPHPVMMGFVNGLAIVIFLSQVGMFKDYVKNPFGQRLVDVKSTHQLYVIKGQQWVDPQTGVVVLTQAGNVLKSRSSRPEMYSIVDGLVYDAHKKVVMKIDGTQVNAVSQVGYVKSFMEGQRLYTMLLLVFLTLAMLYLLPRINESIPAALIAIGVVSGLVASGIFGLGPDNVETVGSFIRSGGGTGLQGGLPQFQWALFEKVPMTMATFMFIAPYAVILAAIGLIESLMTLNLIDEITESRGRSNKECVAQGGANILTGLFGGMGGCAMIGQSLINIDGGARSRISGIIAALTLLGFIVFAAQIIEEVPIAALVGVMISVVIGTFAWSSFRILPKIPITDAIVLVSVSAITVWQDLAIAVITGVIMSALVFAWENALRIRARKNTRKDGVKVYQIWGPLFFGSVKAFNEKFDVKNDPQYVEIDFIESRVIDHSGLEALFILIGKYESMGKNITLKHLSEECKALMRKASHRFHPVIVEAVDDPRYHIVGHPESLIETRL